MSSTTDPECTQDPWVFLEPLAVHSTEDGTLGHFLAGEA